MKSIFVVFIYLLSASLYAATVPAHIASPNGLEPCASSTDDYEKKVDGLIAAPLNGRILARFTAHPSFQPEWGVVLFAVKSSFLLRVVKFDNSLWYSALEEVRPGVFVKNFEKVMPTRSIDEVQISKELATLIQQTFLNEIAAARAENARSGFDGETYRFVIAGSCAKTLSPDGDSRPAQLVEAVESLRTFARIPGSWFRRVWEPSVIKEWLALTRPKAVTGKQ